MKYLETYKQHQEMNEGLRNWLSTFLILTGLGLVPPSISLGQNKKAQKEFVQNMDQSKIDGALFVDFLNRSEGSDINKLGSRSPIDTLFSIFKKANPSVKSDLNDVKKYVNKSGRQYIFNQAYITHDYSTVDITKFQPDNYLTDMGNMIEDTQEPIINNWISDYEKLTSVEIGVVTVTNLNGADADDYATEQFRRIGVGKKGANNGVLLVFSKEDRKWVIRTGYGMEGILPDVTCLHIADDYIIPKFREGDYFGGIMGALEQIKKYVGTDNIQIKKDFLQQKKDADDRESAIFWSNFWDMTMTVSLILLLMGSIGYGIYKRQKRIKEAREMKENIDRIFSEISDLKSKFPDAPGIRGSKSLDDVFDSCKKYFDTVSSAPEYNKDFESQCEGMYDRMVSLYGAYRLKCDEISKFKSSLGELPDIKSTAYDSIEKAMQNAKKINDLGYDVKSVPAKSEIDALDVLIPLITTAVLTDIDKARDIYQQYFSKVSAVMNKGSEVSRKLSSIEDAIGRVKNWENEINRLMSRFKIAGGSVTNLESMMDKFRAKLGVTKDWFVLTKELDSIISFMNSKIQIYEDELRRKREEEEEERRRKRRREEEEEDRRRSSYSSSSSSSSSSSFGGFGGGSSGGGGASGSW